MKAVFIGVITMLLFGCNNKGKTIPSFEYSSLAGENISSEHLKGKATVIAVWATWCGDCIREIPELNQLVEKYNGNDNVEFLAFSDEDEATVNKSLKRFPFNFKHLVNTKSYTDKLKTGVVKHFPQVIVVNDKLEVVFDATENKEPIFDILDAEIQKIITK